MSTDQTDLLGLDRSALQEYFASLGEKSFHARQVLRWIYQRGNQLQRDDRLAFGAEGYAGCISDRRATRGGQRPGFQAMGLESGWFG